MEHFLMYISFDGKNFCGWQLQPNCRSVQGEVERALHIITGEDIRVTGCGRTDAGVHALRYAVSFSIKSSYDKEKLIRSLNGITDNDISFLSMKTVKDNFNARFSPHYKIYSYSILNKNIPIKRFYASIEKIDISKFLNVVKENKEFLVGKYDGSAFCVKKSLPENPWIHIEDIYTEQIEDFGVKIFFKGRRFLHNTIRIIVGTLLDIYKGKIKKDISEIIESKDRDLAGKTAKSSGLCLENIFYDEI